MLELTNNQFDPRSYFTQRIKFTRPVTADSVRIFDQNGYILTDLEQQFYNQPSEHRGLWEHSCQQSWFVQQPKTEYAILNHSLLFERKGFSDQAYDQLAAIASDIPVVWKVAKIRPKWGLDFSIDWCDKKGNVFEVLHWEWDAFDYDTVQDKKIKYEHRFLSADWDDIGRSMLAKKSEWHHLDFFAQSEWKCKYFGIMPERFKMVAWE